MDREEWNYQSSFTYAHSLHKYTQIFIKRQLAYVSPEDQTRVDDVKDRVFVH